MQEPTQPSTANIAVACAIVAGVTGYMLGQAKSLGLFGGSPLSVSAPSERDEKAAQDSDESSGEDSDDDDDDDNTAPADFKGSNEECKLVLVVRTDLGMTKGTAHSLQRMAEKQAF
jgi:PTH2 family peptidyl-tRNA hydrolase